MKKSLLTILLISYFISNAQKIVDTTLIDIPYIGKNGGAHLLNWNFNTDKSELYLYAYSHINGTQIVTNPEEISKAKAAHDEKSFFGKFLSSNARKSAYESTIIPVVLEKSFKTTDFTPIDSIKMLFHRVDELPQGDHVYFKRNSGIVDLSSPFQSGILLKHHYKDLNTPFKYAPEYNKDILKISYVETKGEGLLGLKNIKPVLISKRGFFTYDKNKGYISTTEKKDIVTLTDDERLKGYNFIHKTDQIFNKNYFAWFVKEKDFSKYKLVVADQKGNLTIKDFDFGVPRKLRVFNKGVYNKSLDLKGVLNVFGYHKKGKKSKDIYPTNAFDIIYTDINGEILHNNKVTHGTEKKYKRVITPVLVLENENHQLEFINNHQESLLKTKLERFTLDKEGTITVGEKKNYAELRDEERINYFDYLSDFDRIDKFGEHYVLRKIVKGSISSTRKGPNGPITTKKETDATLNLTVLDKDFNPIDFESISITPNKLGSFKFQTIENTDKEIVFLVRKLDKHFMVKINQTETTPSIDFTPLKLNYAKNAKQELYFGAFSQKFALVHKKERHIYLMNQIYKPKTKIIAKVGITKIAY